MFTNSSHSIGFLMEKVGGKSIDVLNLKMIYKKQSVLLCLIFFYKFWYITITLNCVKSKPDRTCFSVLSNGCNFNMICYSFFNLKLLFNRQLIYIYLIINLNYILSRIWAISYNFWIWKRTILSFSLIISASLFWGLTCWFLSFKNLDW